MVVDRTVVVALDERLLAGEVTITADLAARNFAPEVLVVGSRREPGLEYHWADVEVPGRKQAYNYASSLLKVLREASSAGVETLLYVEDDAVLTGQFDEYLPQAFAEADRLNFDMLYLGGNHRNGHVKAVSSRLLQAEYSLDLHCVIFRRPAFAKLLDIEPSWEHTVDGVIAGRQRQGLLTVLGVHPSIVSQRPGWSHNEGRLTDRAENYWLCTS